MEITQRLIMALDRCPLSGRDIALEMTKRGCPVSHPKVNRWRSGKLPRLDEAAVLAEVAGIDLAWVLYGEGPPPWELTEVHRRILWLAETVGLDEAAIRLSAADKPVGYGRPVGHADMTDQAKREFRGGHPKRRVAKTKGPSRSTDQAESEDSPDRSQSAKDTHR